MKAVQLTKGFVAWVSDEDFERVSRFKWCASIESRGTKVYAIRCARKEDRERGFNSKVRLHYEVLGITPGDLPEGHVVDHADDDGLNCCRENLTILHQRENMAKVANWKKKGQKVECFL